MKYTPLGSSGLKVSRVCLGTMTWGVQNTQADADAQIDYALGRGVNFIDTAEMYAIPPTAETYGKTEEIIGDWNARHKSRRDEFILASKIAGQRIPWIRDGGPVTGQAVIDSVEASLKRLQTDYIDLYQIHWPNRIIPHFNRHSLNALDFARTETEPQIEGMIDILQGLDACVKAGKIRHCGLSDDTPWGISAYMRLAEEHNLPRMVSIQNEFSLLHTKDWPYLIETCVREDVAYLPWSPMASGILSGKYANGNIPKGSRWSYRQRNGLFRDTPTVHAAVEAYKKVADKHGMSVAQLSLLWVDNVNGVASTIIGATKMEQLTEDIDAFDLEYSDELAADIAAVLREYPVPF